MTINKSTLNLRQVIEKLFTATASSERAFLSALLFLQFLLRQEVLQLYRKILKTVREIPNEQDRKYFLTWARKDFRDNQHQTDEVICSSFPFQKIETPKSETNALIISVHHKILDENRRSVSPRTKREPGNEQMTLKET